MLAVFVDIRVSFIIVHFLRFLKISPFKGLNVSQEFLNCYERNKYISHHHHNISKISKNKRTFRSRLHFTVGLLHIGYIHTNKHYDLIDVVGMIVTDADPSCAAPAVVDVSLSASIVSSPVVHIRMEHDG